MDLETFRQYLAELGVTPSILAAIGFISLITLIASVRVVLKWYLGIQRLQDELAAVRLQLQDIRLELSRNALKADPEEGTAGSVAPAKPAETFRLTH